jgi:hypothetical protein
VRDNSELFKGCCQRGWGKAGQRVLKQGRKRQVVRTSRRSARDHPCRALRWYESPNLGCNLLYVDSLFSKTSARRQKKDRTKEFMIVERDRTTRFVYREAESRSARMEAEEKPEYSLEKPPQRERHVAIRPHSTRIQRPVSSENPLLKALLMPLRLRV